MRKHRKKANIINRKHVGVAQETAAKAHFRVLFQ